VGGNGSAGKPSTATAAHGPLSGQANDFVLNPVRLAIFCAVAEHQNFTHAAATLGLTQPAVSGHIRALEEALGTTLFDRRQRGARLTEAGSRVYDFAIGVRRALGELRLELHGLAGGSSGTVTIAATELPGSYVLPELVVAFYRSHTGARVLVRVLPPEGIGEEVLRGRVDFAIVTESASLPGSLQVERLWTDRLLLVASDRHPLARRRRVSIADLDGQTFVAGPARPALERRLARSGLSRYQIMLEFGSPEGVKQAVLAGVGLGLLFERVVAAELHAGQLVALPVEELTMTQRYLLVTRPVRHFTPSPVVQSLVQFLRARAAAGSTDQ
jgi:DNA-binding transcriptional LysR family regulator